MFGFKKDKAPETTEDTSPGGLFSRLRNGLGKTRSGLIGGITSLFSSSHAIDDDLMEELETLLLSADIGIEATQKIINDLNQTVKQEKLSEPSALMQRLKADLTEILQPCNQPLAIDSSSGPFVILTVGINGAGKTTTIGKLAKQLQNQGHSVMLAAGDTFRAAAVEQLQSWGDRNKIPVIAQGSGADSAAVIHDAIEAARARKVDVLIADTAGRLHTQQGLMEELKKVKRVIQKLDANAPHETMLVIDAGTGQNALAQAKQFHEALGLSGISITKLDGTAKGGILFTIAQQLAIPIRYIGVGEGIDDLQKFDAVQFVEALFEQE